MNKCFIIAEAGVNHNGSKDIAIKLIDAAKDAGADAVKFQTFKTEMLVSKNAVKAEYQIVNSGNNDSQYKMLKELELSYEFHHDLVKHCENIGIKFMSSAFDFSSLDFLVKDLKCDVLKVGSGELTNAPFLYAHALTGKKIILSTGMSTMDEIKASLGVILAAKLNKLPQVCNISNFIKLFSEHKASLENIVVLHCTTEYPAPLDEVNLKSLHFLRDELGVEVGYSDHTKGISVATAAVAMGAIVIEKHFTLDNNMEGPDHKASLEVKDFAAMVSQIREVEQAIGVYEKKPSPSEIKNRAIARKGLYLNKDTALDSIISEESLSLLRPENGVSLYEYWNYLGKPASKTFKKGDSLEG